MCSDTDAITRRDYLTPFAGWETRFPTPAFTSALPHRRDAATTPDGCPTMVQGTSAFGLGRLPCPRYDELMQPDDELCLCFHVTLRKVINYIRIQRPVHASQLADCYGAGTGCGWCRRYLQVLHHHYDPSGAGPESGAPADAPSPQLPSRRQHAAMRSAYVRQGGGVPPPGATPIDREDDPGLRASESP
jgi:bacterioferritin-associated ferredoxin